MRHRAIPDRTEIVALFESFRASFPALTMHLHDEHPQVDLLMEVPRQSGLAFDVTLNLQADELHLSAGTLSLEWFPCTDSEVVARYQDAVSGLLSGRYRILESAIGNRVVKAQLQRPDRNRWQTIGTWRNLGGFLPWRRSTQILQNRSADRVTNACSIHSDYSSIARPPPQSPARWEIGRAVGGPKAIRSRPVIPAGYMAKRVVARPAWLPTERVSSIYSVSGCVSKDFADYITFWKHNGYWLFNSPGAIIEIARENSIDLGETTLFFYEVHELQFNFGEWTTFDSEPSFLTDVSVPETKVLEGYDVVTFYGQTSAERSPLSCNSLAADVETNARCLLQSFEQAQTLLENGTFNDSEPGPYRIFAVYSVPGV